MEGSGRCSAFLFTPLVHLRHSGPLPLRIFSEADGEHEEDHEDHQQHCHAGSPKSIHQAFLDAPVAVFPAVPVSIRDQAEALGSTSLQLTFAVAAVLGGAVARRARRDTEPLIALLPQCDKLCKVLSSLLLACLLRIDTDCGTVLHLGGSGVETQ